MEEGSKKVLPKIVWCRPCTGAGWCMIEDVPHECMCGHLRRVSAGMPPFIRKANVEREHVRLPLVKEPMQNAYVEASWSDLRALVKILMMKGDCGHIRVTDDREIRDAYVGSMAKAAKSADYDGVVYNNIADLSAPPNLLVVRLNILTNKNKAAPGALEEAIKIRVDYGKPTWLLSDHDRPFNQASHAYSEDVANLMVSEFRKYVVKRINKADKEMADSFFSSGSAMAPTPSIITLDPDGSQVAREVPPSPSGAKEERRAVPSEPDDDGDLSRHWGGGISQSRSKSRSKLKRG